MRARTQFWSGVPATLIQKVDTKTIEYYLAKSDENEKLASVHMAEHAKTLDVLEAEKVRASCSPKAREWTTTDRIRVPVHRKLGSSSRS